MAEPSLQIWERSLADEEWRALLGSPAFMSDLKNGVEWLCPSAQAGQFLLISNWTRAAHEALLSVLPCEIAAVFDLTAFRSDGSFPRLDETEGFRLLSGYDVCPDGWDFEWLLPGGLPAPVGPYADITLIERVPLPIRLDLSAGARLRVVPEDGVLMLVIGVYCCGQAVPLANGTFRVEEVRGEETVVLAENASHEVAADLLFSAGKRRLAEADPRLGCLK